MEFKNMNVDELIERRDALVAGLDAEDADLDAIEEEVRAIKAELEERKVTAKKKADICDLVANGAGEVKDTFEKVEERKTMDIKEIRNSEAYVNAFAEYIKTGDDRECRGIITENGGTIEDMTNIPVPVIVDEIVRTAWEKNEVLSRVKKTYIKGNLKIAYEKTATGAEIHEEGTAAIDEETLTLGIVEMVPVMIKKWIRISDEAVAMGGEALLRYVYDELTYRILDALETTILSKIGNITESNDFVTIVNQSAISVTTIAETLAVLSPEATDPVAIMSRRTWADFKKVAAAANYAVDPFEGLPVLFAKMPTDTVIVGDLKGVTVNYPEGEDVIIKWDDLTEATSDMVRVIGRQYVACDLTSPNSFAFAKVLSAPGD